MSDIERVAIIVDPNLGIGFLANTVATIGIGLGAAAPDLGNATLTDIDGRAIKNSANRAVPVLQAQPEIMAGLLLKASATQEGGILVAFPAFARAIHSFDEYREMFPSKDLKSEAIEGIGLAGPEKWVKSLTGSLKLLR